MESTETETLQLEIIGLLCKLSADNLKELCDSLTIAFEHVAGKNRASLITSISNHLQREDLQELEDMEMAELLSFKDEVRELCDRAAMAELLIEPQAAANEQQNGQGTTWSNTAQESRPSQLQPLLPTGSVDGGNERKAQVATLLNSTSASGPGPGPSPISPISWHKEFKIAGQIGEPGQKDRLTFSSLARQIEHGLLKGFPETEIVDAVIRAIVP